MRRFPMAEAISTIFKLLAVLVVAATVYVVVEVNHSNQTSGVSSSENFKQLAAIIAGGVIIAAAIGFFAYVLVILMAIEENTGFAVKPSLAGATPRGRRISAPGLAKLNAVASGRRYFVSDTSDRYIVWRSGLFNGVTVGEFPRTPEGMSQAKRQFAQLEGRGVEE